MHARCLDWVGAGGWGWGSPQERQSFFPAFLWFSRSSPLCTFAVDTYLFGWGSGQLCPDAAGDWTTGGEKFLRTVLKRWQAAIDPRLCTSRCARRLVTYLVFNAHPAVLDVRGRNVGRQFSNTASKDKHRNEQKSIVPLKHNKTTTKKTE